MTTEAVLVAMPRLSDSMEEGTVVAWLKNDGDTVQPGEDLVEIETDKATITYQAESRGVLRRLAQEGEAVALGAPLAELLPEGTELAAAVTTGLPATHTATESEPEPEADARALADSNGSPGASPRPGDRIPASPVARRLAGTHGVDLALLLPGSGPRGRVVKRDVEGALASENQAEPTPSPLSPASQAIRPARGAVETEELTRLHTTVARRMAESRATVPDFSVEVDVDVEELVGLRSSLREQVPDGRPPSYNDFVVKASALALRAHPRANGAYRDGRIERYERVNVGVAVDANGALLVPVVVDADIKSIAAIASETRQLADSARRAAATPADLSGGTFTVSNLGMYGITRFTAIVNPPQAAILAAGAIEQRAVVRDGALRVGHVMTLTLCVDHRILFGADAAAFLTDIRAGLEQPLRLLV